MSADQLRGHQPERIRTSFHHVCAAQQAAAQSLLATAPDIGMDTSRAVLDTAAHRHITARTWASVPAPGPAAQSATVQRPVVLPPAELGRGARV